MNIAMLLNPKVEIAYLYADDSVRQGLEKFKIHKYSAVPVLNSDGQYFSIVRDQDFLSYIIENNIYNLKELESVKIKDIIEEGRNSPVYINATLNTLMASITDWNFVPVVDSRDFFIGIITRKSVINYLSKFIKDE